MFLGIYLGHISVWTRHALRVQLNQLDSVYVLESLDIFGPTLISPTIVAKV